MARVLVYYAHPGQRFSHANAALARVAAGRGLRALDEDDVLGAEARARWTSLWPLLAWAGAVFLFEWGAWVHVGVPRVLWLTRYVVLFAPLFGMYAVAWIARAEVEMEVVHADGSYDYLSVPTAELWAQLVAEGELSREEIVARFFGE